MRHIGENSVRGSSSVATNVATKRHHRPRSWRAISADLDLSPQIFNLILCIAGSSVRIRSLARSTQFRVGTVGLFLQFRLVLPVYGTLA
jgi:hypothetical protein